jgi:hypothetical protein
VKIVSDASGDGSIGAAYGDCPDLSLGLKLQRRMKGILLEEPIFLICQLLDCLGQPGIELLKARRQERA